MRSGDLDRRSFLRATSRAGLGMCGLCLCSGMPDLAAAGEPDGAPIDPAKLEYCGYTCPDDCKFHQATVADDPQLKREAFEAWKLEERYGLEFDPDTAICHRCKAPGKPEGVVVANCDVRRCVREKKLECCIECDDLQSCDKDLWKRFTDFHTKIVDLQARYRAQT